MSDPKRDEPSSTASGENKAAAKASPPEQSPGAVPASDVDPSKPVQELTPEEQMALYEKDLKENDWGHQPC